MTLVPFPRPLDDDAHRYASPDLAEAQAASEEGHGDHLDMGRALEELERIDVRDDQLAAVNKRLIREIQEHLSAVARLTAQHGRNLEERDTLNARADNIRGFLREVNAKGLDLHRYASERLDAHQRVQRTSKRRARA